MNKRLKRLAASAGLVMALGIGAGPVGPSQAVRASIFDDPPIHRYSFRDGRFRVSWQRWPGPFGVVANDYVLRNVSGRRRKVKLNLERISDTSCQWVNDGGLVYWYNQPGFKF